MSTPTCPNCNFSAWVEALPEHQSHAEKTAAHTFHAAYHGSHYSPLVSLGLAAAAYGVKKLMEKRSQKEWKCTHCGHEF